MNIGNGKNFGLAGKIANAFVDSKLTPLIVVASLALGVMAVWWTPREEEPQIKVPMIDVMVTFPGASPKEVEERITTPVEKLLWEIPDVEYLYSSSSPGFSLVTVRFKVGTSLEPAVVRIHHKLREHLPEKPEGISHPLVRSYTIDDVPFLALTFHSGVLGDYELRRLAQEYARQLAEIPDLGKVRVIGGEPRQVRILPDPVKIKRFSVSLLEYFEPLLTTNIEGVVGKTQGKDPEWLVEVGGFFESAEEVAESVIGIKGGRAVRVKDVAEVVDGPAERTKRVLFAERQGPLENAVTLSFAKRPGVNATTLARAVLHKVEKLKSELLLSETSITVTRNYGETAAEKSNTLIEHLLIASGSVVLLMIIVLGLRPALVVGLAVPVTLALTLLIYFLFGYTLNRVTLFALIFSIGILVDDAIVVVENIYRHLKKKPPTDRKSMRQTIVGAVNEVGNPTILATYTVIAAILPMAFVRGLMGPYMRPIPIGASLAMLFSLFIAFAISPWVCMKIYGGSGEASGDHGHGEAEVSKLDRLYDWMMAGLLDSGKKRILFGLIVLVFFVGIGSLVYFKVVRVKMLPFDNKSELQVMIDLDEGTPLERTVLVAKDFGEALRDVPEVLNYQIYAGSSAPVNFNGLVRHYFLRQKAHWADIQVNLTSKHDRHRKSHEIAKAVRTKLLPVARKHKVRLKVVEIPPGPPVLATMVSEVYGPTHEQQIELAEQILSRYRDTPGIVDADWSVEKEQDKFVIRINRRMASLKKLPVERVFRVVATAIGGARVGLLHAEQDREPVPILVQLPSKHRKDLEAVLDLKVPALDGSFVRIGDVAEVSRGSQAVSILHKNLQRVVYVMGELAGREESPVYAIQQLSRAFGSITLPDGRSLPIETVAQPEITDHLSMKWDGEWQITYEVFRDLGIAFAVVLVLIYVLVVGWFRSFVVPLVIMAPIPLSLIGIIPGHWMFGAFFTATSMIGFIAGAGIIIRNSIILVDFIELGIREGRPAREAVLEAGRVRFRPMLLTAAAVVVGSFVILFDPIFQGLAISLMMGEVAATVLSRFAVPLLYYRMVGARRAQQLRAGDE